MELQTDHHGKWQKKPRTGPVAPRFCEQNHENYIATGYPSTNLPPLHLNMSTEGPWGVTAAKNHFFHHVNAKWSVNSPVYTLAQMHMEYWTRIIHLLLFLSVPHFCVFVLIPLNRHSIFLFRKYDPKSSRRTNESNPIRLHMIPESTVTMQTHVSTILI